jgi:transcriptional regulator
LLVSHGALGLIANPVPFTLVDGGEKGVLRCHLARANEQGRDLATASECLVVFQGPQAYVTPSWYASKREHGRVVPTWNYATVHAWGRPSVHEDPAWLHAQISDLTTRHEAPRSQPWAVTDAPDAFVAAQMRAIVGVEIPIARIEGKWKVSQNRPEADRVGVRDGLGTEHRDEMADLVAERGGLGSQRGDRSSG